MAEKLVEEYGPGVELISDIIFNGKSYNLKDRTYAMQQKAKFCFFRAKDRSFTEPTDARKDFQESLVLQLGIYKINLSEGHFWVEDTYDHAMKSAFALFDITLRDREPSELVDTLRDIFKQRDVYFDPMEKPVAQCVTRLIASANKPEILSRIKNKAKSFESLIGSNSDWHDAEKFKKMQIFMRDRDADLSQKMIKTERNAF